MLWVESLYSYTFIHIPPSGALVSSILACPNCTGPQQRPGQMRFHTPTSLPCLTIDQDGSWFTGALVLHCGSGPRDGMWVWWREGHGVCALPGSRGGSSLLELPVLLFQAAQGWFRWHRRLGRHLGAGLRAGEQAENIILRLDQWNLDLGSVHCPLPRLLHSWWGTVWHPVLLLLAGAQHSCSVALLGGWKLWAGPAFCPPTQAQLATVLGADKRAGLRPWLVRSREECARAFLTPVSNTNGAHYQKGEMSRNPGLVILGARGRTRLHAELCHRPLVRFWAKPLLRF